MKNEKKIKKILSKPSNIYLMLGLLALQKITLQNLYVSVTKNHIGVQDNSIRVAKEMG